MLFCPVMRVFGVRFRLATLDYKRASRSRIPTPKQSGKLLVNRHVARPVGTFWSEMLRGFNADNPVIPAKGLPFQFVDLVVRQTSHRSEQKNFPLFLRQFAH